MKQLLHPQRLALVLLSCLLLTTFSCKKDEAFLAIDPAFSNYISAFTSGIISKEARVRIRLAQENTHFTEQGSEAGKLFSFSPDVKGKAYWVDNRTLEFVPEKPLQSAQTYTCSFRLQEICQVEEKNLGDFRFQLQVIKQGFYIETEVHKTYEKTDLTRNRIPGTLLTADVADAEEFNALLTATQNGKSLPVQWEHDAGRKIHRFEIQDVIRGDKAGKVLLSWDGKSLGAEQTGSKEIEIPSLSDFKVMQVKVVQQPEQHIQIDFSDPLDEKQSLEGFIRIKNNTSQRFIVEENTVKAYPAARQSGNTTLTVEKGIKNILEFKMPKSFTQAIVFEEIKPAVRLIGKGVILPNSNGLIFPFEAVNLNAVDVSVVEIYENNIAQFMQVNELDGDYQLKRVGRQILKSTIKLGMETPVDLGKWNTFSFDLAKLVQASPGSIYRIELSFKKSYSLYPCSDSGQEDAHENLTEVGDNWDEDDEKEQSNWDYTEDYYSDYYYDYYYDDYDWQQRDNPCHKSYYTGSRKVSRNVLASNLGVLVKGNTNATCRVFVTDLLTAEPISGAVVEVLNFQQQKVGSGTTGNDGSVLLELSGKAFMLVAEKNKQYAYLRMDDGAALATGSFDVSGNTIEKGLKGFIYGERGVWRPGDSLFLTFMLEDADKRLPKNHPVTMELYEPRGQIVSRMVNTKGVNGVYDFRTVTAPDAPTGNWSAKVKVGGASFQKTLKIETIKPNRLKIKLDFGTDLLTQERAGIRGNMHVSWLHGATAKNLKAQVNASLSPVRTEFKKFAEYNFEDPTRSFYSEEYSIYEGKTDAEGKADFTASMSGFEGASGMLKANFITRVFEEGGDFSIDRYSMPFSPYPYYVGIKTPKGDKARGMLLTDTNHIIEVVTVNEQGQAVPRSGLQVEVYKIEWTWWWDANAESNLASYAGSSYHSPIKRETINTGANGKGNFIFRINYPDWGRYLIRVYDPNSGHSTAKTVYADWPGWAGRAQRENPAGANLLPFSADKEKYKVGETAKVSIPSPAKGKILVSLENGTKVLDYWWQDAAQGETSVQIKIKPEMCPNMYVHITLVQPHGQTGNDMPMRMYGVIPLLCENPETILHPEIDAPKVMLPEEVANISVKEKDGKPMTYTLAIVDEGLLDLTRFKTPDPWSHFYAREALGVKTWDMFDYVMGAFGGRIEQIFGLGGDGELNPDKGGKSAQRFKPMVRFMGPFTVAKGKTNKHAVSIPRYVGSVRIMVVARDENAYGSAEKAVPVRKPLMLLATMPRVAAPDEIIKVPVSIFAMEKNVKNVSVELKPNALFKVMGPSSKNVSFSEPGDELITFDVKAAGQTGIGKVQIIASSGSEKATYEIEMDIRHANTEITNIIETAIEPGETWNSDYTPPGIAGSNKGILEISSLPPLNLGSRLKFLIAYPHGCIEQTTSGAFPQLFVSSLMDINKDMQQQIKDNIQSAINRLRSFQLGNGGLAYWPGSTEADDWGTTYAGHFMLEAEAKGYSLPLGFKDNWIKYQKNAARNWRSEKKKSYGNDDFMQAYRLYTLALAGQAEMGAMNRLRENDKLSVQARWRLAAAYALAGQPEAAKKLITDMNPEIKPYNESYYTYGSAERDYAMMLETMALMKDKKNALPLLKKVCGALGSEKWLSTQTTAYALIAVSKYASAADKKNMQFTYTLNNGSQQQAETGLPLVQVPVEIKGKNAGKVQVVNKGKGLLFARIILSGVPAAGEETEYVSNLKTEVVFKRMNGTTIDVSQLEQGMDFMAEVTVSNPGTLGNYKNLALHQVFPSGWEIRNLRLDGTDNLYKESTYDYRDIRDDRVYTYFSLKSGEQKKFIVLLNASYLGRFYMPGVVCESMYENSIQARKKGQWVEVVRQVGMLSSKE